RMTQFKDKARSGGEEAARVGLFTYPVLMAADILVYGAHRVPVGDDQRQHLELARTLAERFNTRHGEVFVVPEAAVPPPGRGARVMDLQDPTSKMSKSAGADQGVILLLEPPASIERKLRRAVTDSEEGAGSVRYDPVAKPGVSNLLELLGLATGRGPEEVAESYSAYGSLKADTAAAVVELVRPIQTRYAELAAYPDEVARILAAGAEGARELAAPILSKAMTAMGLLAG
ncbi:MAG: tryptophan--tRNA ligase, partial [Acidimicrobiales bacterium]